MLQQHGHMDTPDCDLLLVESHLCCVLHSLSAFKNCQMPHDSSRRESEHVRGKRESTPHACPHMPHARSWTQAWGSAKLPGEERSRWRNADISFPCTLIGRKRASRSLCLRRLRSLQGPGLARYRSSQSLQFARRSSLCERSATWMHSARER